MSGDETLDAGAFTAIVLAGERPGVSPVAEAAGVCCKALAEVAGRPMVQRVLDALGQSETVGRRILCGLPRDAAVAVPVLSEALSQGLVEWREGRQSPSRSTASVLQTLDPSIPVLLTTADHALLEAEMVDYFCRQAQRTGADLVVALAGLDKRAEATEVLGRLSGGDPSRLMAMVGALDTLRKQAPPAARRDLAGRVFYL